MATRPTRRDSRYPYRDFFGADFTSTESVSMKLPRYVCVFVYSTIGFPGRVERSPLVWAARRKCSADCGPHYLVSGKSTGGGWSSPSSSSSTSHALFSQPLNSKREFHKYMPSRSQLIFRRWALPDHRLKDCQASIVLCALRKPTSCMRHVAHYHFVAVQVGAALRDTG